MKIALNKLCRKCNTEKSLASFSKDAQRKDGLQPRCKACEAARTKAWADANKQKVAAKNKAYREANPEKVAADAKAYREANPEYGKAWREANKDRVVALNAKYRAAKLKRTPPWLTQEHHDQITSIYAERERITQATGIEHHVDHILPLQGKNVCGLHVPWNLRVITAQDNLRKSNKH